MHVVLFSVILALGSAAIIFENREMEFKLAEFAAKAYRKFCPEGKTTLMVHCDADLAPDIFLNIVGRTGHNMTLFTYNVRRNSSCLGSYDRVRADMTVLFVNEHDGSVFANIVRNMPSFHSFTKMLVVYTFPTKTGAWIEDAFRFMWSHRVMRIFIAFWDYGVKVYTFNPFHGQFSIDISNATDDRLKFLLEFELFDLNGYPLKVYLFDGGGYRDRVQEKVSSDGTVEYLGYDGKLLTQVRNTLNVTLILARESDQGIMVAYNGKYANRTWISKKSGVFLEKYKFDIWFTAIRAKAFTDTDNLFLHERDDYVVIVPKGERIPSFMYLFYTVPYQLWVATGMLCSICVFLLWYIRKFYKCKRRSFFHCYEDIYKHSLTLPISNYNDNDPERILLTTFIMFFMVYIAAFNSSMISQLINPKYRPDIDTIDELVESNMTVWTTKNEYALMNDTLQGRDSRLMKNLAIRQYKELEAVMMLTATEKCGFLTRFERAREFLKAAKKYSGMKYTIMREHPVPNAQSYVMPKGHPYLEEIQWIIHKVHESGLYYEWRKTNYGKENISMQGESVGHQANQMKVLKLVHLQAVFFVHIVFLLAALFVFLGELLVKYYKN